MALLDVSVAVAARRGHVGDVTAQIIVRVITAVSIDRLDEHAAELDVQRVFTGFEELVVVIARPFPPPVSRLVVQDFARGAGRRVTRAEENAVGVRIARGQVVGHPAVIVEQGAAVVIPVHRHGERISDVKPPQRPFTFLLRGVRIHHGQLLPRVSRDFQWNPFETPSDPVHRSQPDRLFEIRVAGDDPRVHFKVAWESKTIFFVAVVIFGPFPEQFLRHGLRNVSEDAGSGPTSRKPFNSSLRAPAEWESGACPCSAITRRATSLRTWRLIPCPHRLACQFLFPQTCYALFRTMNPISRTCLAPARVDENGVHKGFPHFPAPFPSVGWTILCGFYLL